MTQCVFGWNDLRFEVEEARKRIKMQNHGLKTIKEE
jgi:hypothetical protein